jgi:hypothetical protein
MTKILLRHLTVPLSEEQIGKIRQEQHLSAPKECLGGQEKGFFFFTASVCKFDRSISRLTSGGFTVVDSLFRRFFTYIFRG